MESKLMPCPFCGSENVMLESPVDEKTGDDIKNRYFIVCADCFFESGVYTGKTGITGKWNRRSADDHK